MVAINFGIFDEMEWPEEKTFEQLIEDKVDLVRRAEKIGCFDTFFTIERHFTRLSFNNSQSVIITFLSQKTSRMRFGALVYVLPLRNPLHLAEEICLLDRLTGGRLEVGLGSGISELELSKFGFDASIARQMSREAVEIILEYFRSEELNYNGKFYRYRKVKPLLRPHQLPHPPIWIPSRNKETMKWLGSNGMNTAWFFDSNEEIKQAFDIYWDNYSQTDRTPKVGIVRHVYVSRSDEDAINKVKPYVIANGRNERYLYSATQQSYATPTEGYKPIDLYLFDKPDLLLKHDIVLAGSPKTITNKIKAAISLTRANYFMPYFEFGNMEHSDAIQSLELFGNEVFPAFVRR